MIGESAPDWMHALAGVDALDGVDVVIDHSGPLGALLTSRLAAPGLHVTHGPLHEVPAGIYAGIARHSPLLRLVAISEAQRAMAPGLPFAGVCHNGLALDAAPFRARPEGYLAFLGRMSPEKGPADAIRIARAAGVPLLIGAKCREEAEHAYFAEHVAPFLGPDVVWLGELTAPEKYELLGGARALLFPIAWPEPFGMVMIEAMACGTPVLATARGSVPEVVADGVTGFVRETPGELVEAVRRIDEIDRAGVPATRGRALLRRRDDGRLRAARARRAGRDDLGGRPAGLRRWRAPVSDAADQPAILVGDTSAITLIDGLTFAISDALGDIEGGSSGLIADDTRHLSRLRLSVDDDPVRALGAAQLSPSTARFRGFAVPEAGRADPSLEIERRRRVGRRRARGRAHPAVVGRGSAPRERGHRPRRRLLRHLRHPRHGHRLGRAAGLGAGGDDGRRDPLPRPRDRPRDQRALRPGARGAGGRRRAVGARAAAR